MQLIKQILSLQIVMTLSIGLLLFIGIGESYRVVPSLLLTDVCNQSQLLKSSIENNLKLGIPIEFKGFQQRANMLASQSGQIVDAKIIINQEQKTWSNSETLTLTCDMTDKDLLQVLTIDWEGLLHNETFAWIV